MRNLIINKLQFRIKCDDASKYGATVKFVINRLNIIFGPNSTGKSSIITGIIYALGGQRGLGIFKTNQNPFKPEFYSTIDNKKIISSEVLLEISNGKKTLTIQRDIIGNPAICHVFECSMDELHENKSESLIIDGEGVMSEKGFQSYLFKFLEWNLVDVPTYEMGQTKLYLENLIPLFFVEQRAGWSQIQARQVHRYNIRDVRKVAFEYLMGLDKFDIHLIGLKHKENLDRINRIETEIKINENTILSNANGSKDSENRLIIDKYALSVKTPIQDLIKELEIKLNRQKTQISLIKDKKDSSSGIIESDKDRLREVSFLRRNEMEKINGLIREVASYQNYISKIERNKKKNEQLKKLTEASSEFNISYCPLCQKTLSPVETGHCQVCRSVIERISTPEENIRFLEDEKSSFIKIIESKKLELEKSKKTFEDLKNQERSLKETLDYQIRTYSGKELEELRTAILDADFVFNDIQKFKTLAQQWELINETRKKLLSISKEDQILKKKISEYQSSVNDKEILSYFIGNFKSNLIRLRLFDRNDARLNELKIDETDNYIPYMDSFDLFNISSSSDTIRIFLSYYLALLQTSLKVNTDKIRFPNLLIFDEPKQQNLDLEEIKTFIDLTQELPLSGWQIIMTTYEQSDRQHLDKFIIYEMKNSDDYLIKRIQ